MLRRDVVRQIKRLAERISWCISNLIPVDFDLWECEESPTVATKQEIIGVLMNQWRATMKSIAFLVSRLSSINVDIGEDQHLLDDIGKIHRARVIATISSEQEPLVSGLIQKSAERVSSEDAVESHKDTISLRVQIHAIIASIIYDLILVSKCTYDLLETFAYIDGNREMRDSINGQIMRLFPGLGSDGFGIIYKIVHDHYDGLIEVREIYDMIRERMSNLIDDLPALMNFLSAHLHPLETEKKMMGEVFTPPKLICKMLDKLGEVAGPEIWSNPHIKFFDSSAGMGNFPVFIYQRLMAGLAHCIPDEAARKSHILRKMLYMCELNPKNAAICREIFPRCPHIHQGDFLEFDPVSEWGSKYAQFDVIVGNPPYNAPCTSGRAHGGTLYPKFLVALGPLLVPGGYQVMVHPGIWRKPGHKQHDLMFGRTIRYLEIHTKKEGQKLFGATTRYEWYVLQNQPPNVEDPSIIRFDDGRIERVFLDKNVPLLVNHGLSIFEKIMARAREIGALDVRRGGGGTRCMLTPNDEYKYPFINSTSRSVAVKLLYSAREHPHQKSRKVIFANNEVVVPLYDRGYYGTTQNTDYINLFRPTTKVQFCAST